MASADRRFLYADVGYPGVLSDSTIFERSKLREMIHSEQWPGPIVPTLQVGSVGIRPYIIGDGAFSLSKYMMKTSFQQEVSADADLLEWNRRVSQTRKPVECPFGILKKRFSTLSNGVSMEHEDDSVYFITASLILHNLCIEQGDHGSEFVFSEELNDDFNPSLSHEGKRVRAALLQFARAN